VSVRVVLLKPPGLTGGEPPSQIANRGSTHQAPSQAGDDAAEPMLAVALPRQHWPWCHQVDIGHGVTSLTSLAGNGAVEKMLVMA
jgi:hypothetical protein